MMDLNDIDLGYPLPPHQPATTPIERAENWAWIDEDDGITGDQIEITSALYAQAHALIAIAHELFAIRTVLEDKR